MSIRYKVADGNEMCVNLITANTCSNACRQAVVRQRILIETGAFIRFYKNTLATRFHLHNNCKVSVQLHCLDPLSISLYLSHAF